jgi:transposase
MPMPISNEVRRLILRARDNGYSVKEIIEIFDVKKTAVYDLFSRTNETGSYEPLPHGGGRKPALSQEQLDNITRKINEQPDITLQELIDEFHLPVCISALCRTINNKLGLRFKKNSARRRTKS